MKTRSIALFGATGLVGQHSLELLLDRPEFARVVVCVRREMQLDLSPAQRAKLELHVIDFQRLASHAPLFAVEQVLCALGTTIRKAGSQQAFRTVDFVYPEQIARLGVEHGARHFLLVSALGANARSAVFYNRVKGELEDAVRATGTPVSRLHPHSPLAAARRSRRIPARREDRGTAGFPGTTQVRAGTCPRCRHCPGHSRGGGPARRQSDRVTGHRARTREKSIVSTAHLQTAPDQTGLAP
jgi:uncharacterized protein YbjT (DUF2867 family)